MFEFLQIVLAFWHNYNLLNFELAYRLYNEIKFESMINKYDK